MHINRCLVRNALIVFWILYCIQQTMWMKVLILSTLASCTFAKYFSTNKEFAKSTNQLSTNSYEFEMIDLLGLSNRPTEIKRHPSLRSSASKFLLEVYNQLNQEELLQKQNRLKRTLPDDTSLITELDHREIEKCNNIITFSSKDNVISTTRISNTIASDMLITFNTNDVQRDLQLVHSVLRIYQDPNLGRFQNNDVANTTISIYKKFFDRKKEKNEFRIFSSVNTTTIYKGWLEFNITRLLSYWLQHKTLHHLVHGNEILVDVIIHTKATNSGDNFIQMKASDTGLIGTNSVLEDRSPFIIGYFNGPELMKKIQKLRFKREVLKRKRKVDFYRQPPPPMPEKYQTPKTCERLNFTLDFKELHMHNWVIAPKKFEAYFCGGECNFPLGSKMNATNHAIVQTLMHLKQPNLPKPCCVPTVLGSISILHYLNEDSVNLSKYPQSVAKECGCH